MSTRQHNRGPHPSDTELFASAHLPTLQTATTHLSWLLSHQYAPPSSLKIVGDRFSLVARQRMAVMRSACSDHAKDARQASLIDAQQLSGASLEIDGFNLLITIEAALSSGVILAARDGTYRDMASIHGSYRRVSQTGKAMEIVGQFSAQHGVEQILWRLDRPVSNSGRLRAMLLEHAEASRLNWQVELDNDPDAVLGQNHSLVASADAVVLDRVQHWANLSAWIIDEMVSDAWIVPMTC